MGRIRTVLAGLTVVVAMVAGQADAASLEAWTASRWKWMEGVDHITAEKVARAYLVTVEIADVPLGTGDVYVALTCTDGKPVMDFDWSIKVAGKAHLTVEYRFAGQPGRSIKARYVNRAHQQATDIDGIRQFLSDARYADRLRLRVTSDLSGVVEASFNAKAGADIYNRFTAACPTTASR